MSKKARSIRWKLPRPMSLCKVVEHKEKELKLLGQGPFVFFGEIPNMPGHCIMMKFMSREFFNGHSVNFRELIEDKEV